MASFILVHGAWHGGWCWHKVVSELSEAGHRAVAIDLPSHGSDRTPVADVTLQGYAWRIAQEIDAQDDRVVLVGHSMGGIAISQAAEYRADRILSLVYLAALLPAPGDAVVASPDASPVVPHLVPSDDGHALEITHEGARQCFYGDCSREDVDFALENLCAQSAHVFDNGIELSEEKFGSVPRDYIECLEDAALPPEMQRTFYERTPCRNVYRLEASHSPFFSMPGELCRILCDVANQPEST
jgi:pimeloyl-ACP methyl ester carboxylesterase